MRNLILCCFLFLGAPLLATEQQADELKYSEEQATEELDDLGDLGSRSRADEAYTTPYRRLGTLGSGINDHEIMRSAHREKLKTEVTLGPFLSDRQYSRDELERMPFVQGLALDSSALDNLFKDGGKVPGQEVINLASKLRGGRFILETLPVTFQMENFLDLKLSEYTDRQRRQWVEFQEWFDIKRTEFWSEYKKQNNLFLRILGLLTQEGRLGRALIALVSAFIVLICCWQATHYYFGKKKPRIIRDTNIKGLGGSNVSFQDENFEVDAKLKKKIEDIQSNLNRAAASSYWLPNVSFEGPPGTGKTTTALRIVKKAGLPYIYIGGSDLNQLGPSEAKVEFHRIFDEAEKEKNCILIIDEADFIFSKRQGNFGTDGGLLPILLTRVGSAYSIGTSLIFISNQPRLYDPALGDRIGERVEFGLLGPEEAARLSIKALKAYGVGSDLKIADFRFSAPVSGRSIKAAVCKAINKQVAGAGFSPADFMASFQEQATQKMKKKVVLKQEAPSSGVGGLPLIMLILLLALMTGIFPLLKFVKTKKKDKKS